MVSAMENGRITTGADKEYKYIVISIINYHIQEAEKEEQHNIYIKNFLSKHFSLNLKFCIALI